MIASSPLSASASWTVLSRAATPGPRTSLPDIDSPRATDSDTSTSATTPTERLANHQTC